MDTRQEAIRQSRHWWFCENMVCHPGQVGLLRMDFPRVFILIRDYDESYFASFEEFKSHIAELNVLDTDDRDTSDEESILIDAWNFLALEEKEEERIATENNYYQDE